MQAFNYIGGGLNQTEGNQQLSAQSFFRIFIE
jgi:hypothetical protein